MSVSFEDTLLAVYQQSLLENKKKVALEDLTFPDRLTAMRKLKQIDFQFEGGGLRGLEQNSETKSRWAKMARDGMKVMRFLNRGKYIAFVTDGKVQLYSGKK